MTAQPNGPVPPPSDNRLLLPAADAARVLCISERHLWMLTRTKQIPCIRLGRRVLYSRELLEAWIREETQRASS
jgi:excisionase family DNA binding protein